MTDRAFAHLRDMLDFVRELREMADGRSEREFVSDRIRCLATEKLFINIGEAAVRIGERSKEFSEIPWKRIIGLRNIMARGYETIAYEVLFQTIKKDLPNLEDALFRALNRIESSREF